MSNRLDLPRSMKRSLRFGFNSEAFGVLSERFARFLGTANFLVYMSGFVISWVLWNSLAPTNLRFDDFPFIFLTLILSLQASYAAPLILLAQNRQTDRDRIQFAEDRARDERNLADTEYITREIASLRTALNDVATRDFIRGEIRDLLGEIKEVKEKD
ncbi:MAG: DUF1003 domain-containing protein [Actinobacteria bacterium]|uniref:Unannotated protein n=1 Tax=freshwater metagenome TaxID=449393 RepID=A0A6J6NXE4_9ZZZZ|nr:DUF1003 domain-containing protein [Actinomycetota bacterium]MSY05686.1 DUF1003 domain-containing protein [Actinomycetota bacterium]MSY67742.1 DUF1003 domain-containing protein [Actinomycetota bacterium]MTA00859.1 DUF1003 domain-containing protein [Actinomycetota bacterium]